MKLKKHLKKLVHILIKILDEQDKHRIYRKDLTTFINKRINDSRYAINQRQLPKIIKKQKKYEIDLSGRKEYKFEKKID